LRYDSFGRKTRASFGIREPEGTGVGDEMVAVEVRGERVARLQRAGVGEEGGEQVGAAGGWRGGDG